MTSRPPPTDLAPSESGAPSLRVRSRTRALAITGAYAVLAALWIYFSDAVLAALVPDADALVRWSVYKGLAFVAVTSLLLFVLMRGAFRAIETGYQSLTRKDAERRRAQADAERVGRLYAALSHVNQAIVRTGTRQELFDEVCHGLVDAGGFLTAWIGWENDDNRVVPIARAGRDDGYLDAVSIYTDDRPDGQGPSGIAFRSAEPYICNDVRNDPVAERWREPALARGFEACGCFPIEVEGEVLGLLNVYAAETGFFQPREIALLSEVAADVAFALANERRDAARRQAEAVARQERTFSETMVDSLPGILYLYTDEGRFLRWNENFARVSGYSDDEIAEMHPLDFFAPDDRQTLVDRISEVFEKGDSFVEAPFRSKNGTLTPYFFTGRRVELDGRTCLVGVGIDVSERMRAEEERRAAEAALRELNQTLELKVEERTEALRAALVRAEAADRLKSAFLATMSHELRTPLNSIVGFTGILLQELAGPLNPEQAKQLSMVQGSARHLLALINDVLDLSKIEAGQLEVRADAFSLPDAVERVADSVRPLAEGKGLSLEVQVEPGVGEIVADRRRVEQVLLNLVNNGIKFTDRGGITVRAERANGQVYLRVRDTGIGIAPEDQGLLFKPFSQIDTGLTRQHEGTGLGLAICRRLVDLMGGEIRATSTVGEGSEFHVTLPIEPPPSA